MASTNFNTLNLSLSFLLKHSFSSTFLFATVYAGRRYPFDAYTERSIDLSKCATSSLNVTRCVGVFTFNTRLTRVKHMLNGDTPCKSRRCWSDMPVRSILRDGMHLLVAIVLRRRAPRDRIVRICGSLGSSWGYAEATWVERNALLELISMHCVRLFALHSTVFTWQPGAVITIRQCQP